MPKRLIAFAGTFVTMGGGILLTIGLVRDYDAPLLVFPGVLLILAATAAVQWMTAEPGLTSAEKLRRMTQQFEG